MFTALYRSLLLIDEDSWSCRSPRREPHLFRSQALDFVVCQVCMNDWPNLKDIKMVSLFSANTSDERQNPMRMTFQGELAHHIAATRLGLYGSCTSFLPLLLCVLSRLVST